MLSYLKAFQAPQCFSSNHLAAFFLLLLGVETCFFSFLCINCRRNMKEKARYSVRCPGAQLQTHERKRVPTQLICGRCFQEISASRPDPLWVSPKPGASPWGMRPPRKEIRQPDMVSLLRVPANLQPVSLRKNLIL